MAAPTFRNAILCDAVYRDAGSNKAVLAGVYSGDILADRLPGAFKIAMYLEFFPEKGCSHKIELSVLLGGKKYGQAIIETAASDDSPITLLMPPILVKTDEPARLQVHAKVDGRRSFRLIDKQIRLRSPPAAAPSR
ncbi:MAG: hypothetical protein IRZ04_10335 [Rhodospirillales bacterium]|nr:hypothetical protein [Rhodospirillales bacterium]